MCGIVGHIGPKNSVDMVLNGLKRLEYRGYDSAGVCFADKKGNLTLHKKSGKLENLISLLKGVDYASTCCVGHTRWATHGVVNDMNSHPHVGGQFALVHNGIIENADELREQLKAKGYKFNSETDSEVFLVLLIEEFEITHNFRKAVSNAFKKVEGNSAFVVQKSDSREIITIKKGAPIVCGTNEATRELMVSSDPYALIGVVDKIYFPKDDVLCHLNSGEKNLLQFFELDGSESSRYEKKAQKMTLDTSEKGNFEHYMHKEIYEQPSLIENLSRYYNGPEGAEIFKKASEYSFKRVHIIGCGTAYYAGMLIKNFFERMLRIPTSIELASEFRYGQPLLLEGDMALFISQSGETADTLAAQKLCKDAGLPTFSIVNVEGSSLYRECSVNFLIHAGIEIGVASTKAFTQQVLTGRLLVESFTKGQGNSEELIRKFSILSQRIHELLEQEKLIKDVAMEIHKRKGFLYTGRGKYYPTALEGALKLKEIAYVHAEGYASGELKHGPIALIDEDMVNVAIVGHELYEKTLSNIQEIKARRGKIVTLGPVGDKNLMQLSDYFIPLNFVGLGELSPLYVNVANQLLAYHIAKSKGTDIDRPRNLAKSVTVE